MAEYYISELSGYVEGRGSYETMLGETLTKIEMLEEREDDVLFYGASGRIWRMFHCQSCCEYVAIEDVCGDVSDLIGSPITQSEEVSGEQPRSAGSEYVEWTFIKFSTVKGSVTVRWYGTSNGYYSRTPSFMVYTPKNYKAADSTP